MNQVLEFFKNLDLIQWILIGGGLLLLFPTLKRFWNDFWENDEEQDTSEKESPLSGLVFKWESLLDECHKLELHDACSKLNELFPLLGKAYEAKHGKEEGVDKE